MPFCVPPVATAWLPLVEYCRLPLENFTVLLALTENSEPILAESQQVDADGRAEVSLSGLKAGVYVVKSDSITFKIAKR